MRLSWKAFLEGLPGRVSREAFLEGLQGRAGCRTTKPMDRDAQGCRPGHEGRELSAFTGQYCREPEAMGPWVWQCRLIIRIVVGMGIHI